jgi:hypothetical protein
MSQNPMFSGAARPAAEREHAPDRGKVNPLPDDTAMEIARPSGAPTKSSGPAPARSVLQSGGREEFRWSSGTLAAFRRSDVHGALRAEFGSDVDASPEYDKLVRLMHGVFALRNERVTAINNDEIFVLRTPQGELRRITKGVQLSLARKELYQIPRRQRNDDGQWETTVEKGVAQLTVAGLHQLNAIAGCYVGLEPTQQIDGKSVNNPYIERWPDDKEEQIFGDVRRIVITAIVAGLTESGAPVVVRYTYEYEPGKEFLHKIAELHGKIDYKTKQPVCDGIELISRGDFESFKEASTPKAGRKPSWRYVPAFNGIGYAINLSDRQVAAAVADMAHVTREAGKKAQTVAIRNAMRAHPALSRGSVLIDQSTGLGVVRVVGWTGSSDAIASFQERMRAAASVTGQIMSRDASNARKAAEEVIELHGSYDGDDGAQADEDLLAASAFTSSIEDEERNAEGERRGALMALLMERVVLLRSSDDGARIMHDLASAGIDEMERRLDEVNDLLDRET